jgi:hypothetical protein
MESAIVSDTVRRRWTFDRHRRRDRGRTVLPPLPQPVAAPPGWVRDDRRGGYTRQVGRSTLSLHPAEGLWYWVLVATDGSEARYSRGFSKLSAAVRAAESVIAQAEADCVRQYAPDKSL